MPQLTYADLNDIEQDIQLQQRRSPAFSLFNREKIKRFYQQNRVRLQVLSDTMKKLITEYVLHEDDEKGNPKPVTHEVEGQLQYKFIDEEKEEEYEAKAKEFMNMSIEIHI